MTPPENGSTVTPTKSNRIRGVLIDLSGTLHNGKEEIPGAKKAIQRLRRSKAAANEINPDNSFLLRFLTNTSTKSIDNLLDHLNDTLTLGFGISREEMITSLKATAEYVREKRLNPLLLLEDASDFEPEINRNRPRIPSSSKVPVHDSVVVGLAPSKFCYEHLNDAFQILLEHPDHLIAVHRGNYWRDDDGSLRLGPGAFITALETASGCSPATILGKPSHEIFETALHSMNDGNFKPIQAKDVCVIGDDVLADCKGALEAGIGTAILVQTGKYREGDEKKWYDALSSYGNDPPKGTLIVRPSIVEAVEYVLDSIR